jgi:pyruvate dehydrogenase E1 component
VLIDKMNATLDGEYQKYRVETAGDIHEHFFGPDPRLRALVADLSDDELRRLRRGGHDPAKVYAAYRAAVEHTGEPTVVLAKTVKGWALGAGVEARNATHQMLTRWAHRAVRSTGSTRSRTHNCLARHC